MLEKLKEYKELIAIIVFFIGGFIWLSNQYPTKKDLREEVGTLNCLLEKYMTVTQLQLRNQELEKEMTNLIKSISLYDENSDIQLSPAMETELIQIKSKLKHDHQQFPMWTESPISVTFP